jgi:GNAT superfamily N-acetyltransferase
LARRVRRESSVGLLRVRRATLKDLDVLVHQRRAMWIDLGVKDKPRLDRADKIYRRWTATRMRNHTLIAWVVENRGGRIAGGGCLWMHPIQPNPRREFAMQPYLLSMYTEPDFRRRGVASIIVGKAIEWSRKHGYGRLMLHASEIGRKVYKKFGFTRTWEMRLDLEQSSTEPSHSSRERA